MSKKEFKAESKRLLDLMIHSIYTNKEIFLRELISNASDATDKRYYQSVQEGGEALNRDELPITVSIDEESRTLTIEDNGCGMSEKELETNLGVIAKSGSLDFKEKMKENDDVDIIGQFGVGFYSAFMVGETVTVITKDLETGEAFKWESSGAEGYTIEPAEKDSIGTKIIIKIMEDTEDENYSEFLNRYKVSSLIKKYSDYIRYPIRMEMEKYRTVEGETEEDNKTEMYLEEETLNSMTPIWKRRKSEVTDEDYNNFYKDKFYDYQDPMKTIYTSTEGLVAYNALLFIPSHMPMNYYSKDYQKGLQLYASGVLIMDHCADLLPDYFGFVRGVVDSQDLSLNISRELLQQDRQLQLIAKHIEKKIQSELEKMLESEREEYEKFYESFGLSLKYGVYENFGMNKDALKDLLLFHSSNGKMQTLKEYTGAMNDDQKYIYYATGENLAQLENLPAAEAVREKGYDILYFTDQIDEFAIKMIGEYDEKEFRSIVGGDLGLENKEEKEELEKKSEENSELLDYLKELLDGKVSKVTLSPRLKSHPVCLTTEGELTLEMEKVLNSMPGDNPGIKAQRVLELNPDHDVFKAMVKLYGEDKEKLKNYAEILYNQSLLLEGLPIEDPVAFTDAVSGLMI